MECPLCQSSEGVKPFQTYSRFILHECDYCDFMFQTNAQSIDEEEMVKEVYDANWIAMRERYAHLTFQDHALFNTLQLEIFKPEKGRLLEIGSGTGEFLYTARSAGWDVTGVEPSALSCAYAKQKYQLELHNAVWNKELAENWEPFDAIVFWHVLEHIPKPVDFLNQVTGLLKDDGRLFFSIPNLRSFTNVTYGAGSPLFTEVDHLYHYSIRSLSLLLEQIPLKPVSIFTRQLLNHLEQLMNITPGSETLSLKEKMAVLASIQGQGMGHEICCIAQKQSDK